MDKPVDNTTTLKDIMTTPVVSVSLTHTVYQVLQLAKEMNVTGFPVVDVEGKLIGVVSTLDLLTELGAGKLHSKLGELPLAIKVEKNVVHFTEDILVKDALLGLIKKRVGRIVITDKLNRVRGIVSRKDFINFFIDLYDLDIEPGHTD